MTVEREHSCRPESSRPTETIYSPAYRGLTWGVVVTVLLVAFEALAVTTAMPVVARELDGLALYAWAFSGFFAASLVGMVVAGEMCDVHGPRLPFLASVGAFVAGLVLAGLAPAMPVFIAGRVVQGLGAGALVVALYVIVAKEYPERLRARAFGAMATGWVVPSLVGPALAGYLAERLSWRLVFLLVPVLVVPAVALMLPRLVHLRDGRRGGLPRNGRRGGLPRNGRKRRAVAAAVGLGLLQYAGQHLAWVSLPALVAAAVLLAVSVPRLLPPGTLRLARGLPTVVAQRGLLMGSLIGAESFVPLMLVTERHLRPALAGTILTSGALTWAFASWWQGRVTDTARRWLLIRTGGTLLALGIGLTALALVPSVSPYVAVVGWAVVGVGMGLAVSSISVLLFALAPEDEHGSASAAVQISDALGSVVFVALAGVLYAGLRAGPRGDTPAFLAVLAVMGALAVGAAVAAGRIRRPPAPSAVA